MTDNAALLLNYVTLAENGGIKLEIGKAYLDNEDFEIRNRAYVDGQLVLEFTMSEVIDAGLDVDRVGPFMTRGGK